jgi:hypothetical protein
MIELMNALNYLDNFIGARQAIIDLANAGRKNPEIIPEVIRLIKLKIRDGKTG